MRRLRSRPLLTVIVLLLLAAFALWISSALPANSPAHTPGVPAAADPLPHNMVLTPLALLALAAIAGAVALSGTPRRLLGAVLLCVPGLAWWQAVDVAESPSTIGMGIRILVWLAGLLVLTAAVVLMLFGHRMPRLGSRYQTKNVSNKTKDTDLELWRALDAGSDPTLLDQTASS